MDPTTATLLADLEEFFTPPGRWMQDQSSSAHDAEGQPVPWYEPGAVAFCLVGGFNRLCVNAAIPDRCGTSDLLIHALGFAYQYEAIAWSEAPGRTQEQVLERIRAARGLHPAAV